MEDYSFLFVDDDSLFLDLIVILMAEIFPAAHVKTLQDPLRITEACASERFDCVVLDHNMPTLSGMACARMLRQSFPYLPIVLSTGTGDEMLAASALQNGVTDYIPKSHLTARSLKRVIIHAMETTSQRRVIDEQREDLETFAFALAHDFKQPLRQISTFCQLLSEELDSNCNSNIFEYMKFLNGASYRLSALVDAMSQYSLMNQPLINEEIDIKSFGDEIVEALSIYIEERRGYVSIDSNHKLHGNRLLMTQIFQNLIVNGLKYNNSSNPHISISTNIDGEFIEISFCDNGIGIEQEYLDDIFKPLLRLHTNAEYEGTGLGLALVRKAMIAQNGSISCRSTLGRGSEFIVKFRHSAAALPLTETSPE